MPNDAKFGLVVGMGLVIAVAVVFFRKEAAPAAPNPHEVSAIGGRSAAGRYPTPPPRGGYRPIKAKSTSFTKEAADAPAEKRHTVAEGETLFSLSRHYYGDGDRFVDLYQANRDVLQTPDQLTPGTVLVIPDLTDEPPPAEEK